jgi:hypothetical protein
MIVTNQNYTPRELRADWILGMLATIHFRIFFCLSVSILLFQEQKFKRIITLLSIFLVAENPTSVFKPHRFTDLGM